MSSSEPTQPPVVEKTGPVRRTESQVRLSDAGFRYRRAWQPVAPRRNLVLVHGYAEHSGRYAEMAMHFARRGYSVHAYDQIGHGRTQGLRGHTDRFERLLDELAAFIDFVRDLEGEDRPTDLVGHSMGGLVVAAALVSRTLPIDRAVLSGALLELGSGTPKWKQWGARLLSPFGGRVAMAAGLDPETLSRDPEVARRYVDDPLVKDRMSGRFAAGMMACVRSTPQAADRVRHPLLILHGGSDLISPPSGSESFYSGLSEAVSERSALRVYPELRHEIFNEPEREAIWQEMIEWLDGSRTSTSERSEAKE